MAEIDSIDIKISAETRKANAAIDSLVKNLGKLANSLKIDTSGIEKLGKIDGSNFQKLGEGIRGLSSGLKNLQNVKKTDFNRLASGIERLSSIQTGNMQAVSSTLKPLADGVSILSNANFDNKNLQSMINSLTRLSNSNIGSLPNVDFTGIGNSLKNLTDSLAGAEKVQQSTISMTNAIAKLADSVANIPIVSSLLSQLGSSLKGFMTTMSGAPAVTEQTTAFTQAIAQLSGAGTKVATTASNIGMLATELKAFMKTMSNAPAVSDSTIRMTEALANLASQGNKTSSATHGLQAVFSGTENIGNKFNNSIKKLSSSMKGLGDSVKKTASKMKSFKTELLSAFGVVGGLYGAIRGIQKSIDISSDLVEVQNVVDTTFKDMSYKVEELAKTSIEQFGLSELSLKQFSSRFQAMGTAMGFPISQMSDMSIELTKLTADMSSFYNVAQEDVARSLQSIFTGETEPLRKYGLDLTQATLQEWALKQGLDADMRSMSQAEKTMLRYQYVLANTTAAQGDFAKTANTWANQIRILKQQFEQLASIIGTAFINMLKPVVQSLNKAMAKVIEFAQTVINALGKIFGWKFEINTKGIAGDFSGIEDGIGDLTGGIEDATEASKKFNKQLQGFDKLNNLTTSDAGKDLEDFGAGIGDIGNLGDIVPGEGLFDKYESDIDTLYKLGKYLGETLKNFLDNIPWDAIKKKAREIGEGLADLINGFIEVDGLGYSIGKSLIEAINTGFEFLNAFVHRLHWESIGHFIADTLNGFFENMDWELIRDTFVTGFKGLADGINRFIEDFHWDNISNTISNAINIIAETVYTFFSTVNWDELGRNLGNQLMETIRKIDWEQVGMALGSVVQSALDFLKSFLSQLDMSEIAKAFMNALKGFFEVVDAGDLAKAILTVISIKLVFSASKFGFSLAATAIMNALKSAFLGTGSAAVAESIGLSIGGSIISGLLAAVAVVGSYNLLTGHMEELFVAFGRSADQGRRMEERWKGLGGAATFVKDGIDMLKNGIQGYGFAADNCVGSGIALEKAMEDIGNGAIFSEKKMEELQKRFSLTDEDMEMLRQHTLDTNPELRKIADSFSFLGNASAQSLDQITNGLKYVDIGVSSTDEIAARLKRRFGEDLTPTTKNFFDAWFDSSGKLSDNFYELQTGEQVIGGYTDSLKNAQTSMQEFGKEVSNAGQSIANGFESLDSTKISESITTAIGSASESVISIANEVGQKIGGEVGSGISTYDFTQEATSVQGNVSSAMETAFAGNESMQQIGIRAAEGIGEGMGQADVNAPAQTFFGRLLESIKSVFGIASPAKNMMPSGQYITLGILEGFKSKFDAFTAPIQQLCNSITSKIANGLQNMRNTWSNIWNSLPNVVTGVINRITSSLSTLVSNISRAFSSISSGIRSIGSGFSGIGYKTKSQSVTKIKGYAAGGFPEDGWFRASHGEIMGQFDNGQSVVANNNQITDGIEQAAYRGFMRALQSAGTGTSSVNVILEGDAAQFFSYTKEEYNKEASRKGVTSRDPVFA